MKKLVGQIAICSDFEIIEKIVDGDAAFFEVLIRRYNSLLYKIARSFGFNHQDAQDLMQETHVSAYTGLKNFENRSSYKTWISRIMINQCIKKSGKSYVQKETSVAEMIDENAKPMYISNPSSADLNKRELSRIIELSLQHIPIMYRSVFVLREIEGFSVAETAELLSVTTVNVKVRLNRAKAMLQKELQEFYTSSEIYEFNLVYCDRMVEKVFEEINKKNL